jgi:hypothetical protein
MKNNQGKAINWVDTFSKQTEENIHHDANDLSKISILQQFNHRLFEETMFRFKRVYFFYQT